MKTMLLFLSIIASPIWPLGPNPIVGDPFIIINKQTNELAYINQNAIQEIYPVATGKSKDLTPEGEFTVIVKAVDPYYRKKDIIGGDPKNPLGTRWIGFDAKESDGRTYGIHGTNNEDSIGYYVTQGCVRMENKNVENLFEDIPLGTRLLILNSNDTFEELAIKHGAMKK
jgi:lipoprotein-anchoring transpeptidase ErfK/SrfK